MWYAREMELPSIIGPDGIKFQDHKCSTALSPKHPLKSDDIGPSIAQMVAVIMIFPLTLAINRRKLEEEGVRKLRGKRVRERTPTGRCFELLCRERPIVGNPRAHYK